jgi:predicted dehydrogenase
MNQNITVVGRGKESAEVFQSKTGITPILGGFEDYLINNPLSKEDFLVLAVGTEMLMPLLKLLANQDFNCVLVEKPGAISIDELLENQELLKSIQKKVFVAYNRRFYSSVLESKKLIEEDGGLESMHFEFTEWAHKIEPLKKALGVKENWFFANSTHVVDLAFFIAGQPKDWCSYSKEGSLTWHPKSNFSGAGVTDLGVIFSYISNWESAGRWGIELLTKKRRIYLKPLEGVQIQVKGTLNLIEHKIDNSLDLKYKPGLYLQMESFLNQSENTLTLEAHFRLAEKVYKKIL